jgi:hypothetical protein
VENADTLFAVVKSTTSPTIGGDGGNLYCCGYLVLGNCFCFLDEELLLGNFVEFESDLRRPGL